jgi:hypothetical protein
MVQRLGIVLSGIKLRQVKELVETAVIRKYVRWCERTAVQAASYSFSHEWNPWERFDNKPVIPDHEVIERENHGMKSLGIDKGNRKIIA